MRSTLLRQRVEAITVGFDDFAQLTGAPPYATGLRVPPHIASYRFLCAVADLTVGDALVGIRQFAEIASYLVEGGDPSPPAPVYPEKRPIVTPDWHFLDVPPIRWTLTLEPLSNFVRRAGPFDQVSFLLNDTTGPALVYETAHFPAFPTLPGYLGLDDYTAPVMRGIKAYEYRDLRFPQQQNEFFALRIPFESPTRVRLYCDVTQTDPDARFQPLLTDGVLSAGQLAFATGLVPEERFLQDFPDAIFHMVGGSLIIDRNTREGAANERVPS